MGPAFWCENLPPLASDHDLVGAREGPQLGGVPDVREHGEVTAHGYLGRRGRSESDTSVYSYGICLRRTVDSKLERDTVGKLKTHTRTPLQRYILLTFKGKTRDCYSVVG